MRKEIIKTDKAPGAIGPYSQAVKVGNLLFTSGQVPIDPKTGELVSKDIKEATDRVFKNIGAILEEAGTSFENVVKTVVFVKDMNDFSSVNEIYAKYFSKNEPARSCVQAKLPKDALVEIEVVAVVEG
ncbi:2-iminobutanoate/2-iminopropanoate deaminase [Clostridium acetobutylicum]|uniref:Translation initiation inhibitor, yabJ B.subtilis ortholog n=1 Tax=Clostridium acetobutylicum (strain ATCC 824 / DSM 792 / JCM 1419 / IAM 19013 / LMG 5710 / NBRC 13948 / NRRL B-527 / VKM B-1787 / 2291 / W) TaxID=272562 RepID=Q97JK9_CLOAB|nr:MULTISPECIES: RidA family protein [Clostridium]AAK79236.1 Translation initiation inhibitor, yabJ B.subtilis ortholog [Clostridium acetobutylicum ATCC 824]ADZ20316.1 Translation initiation inhibitor, yabJ [Clostridium acetobutylicum EA 2018]AEI33401.1 translation initiation inhibitor [Clostridium acetobutylicum DSM 1731]AWV81514.1 RidA family protein [Clostridium acetobutylicum]KHD35138.1 endoribonuclease L-PSP [Clostridium acetobutylicum]